MTSDTKQQWGSRLGVILAVAGSAVGLGNFLRFPGQAAANGGGAFMIPYFCALLLLGIPIGWAEWAMGRYGGRKGFHSAPAIMGVVGKGRLGRYFGVLGVLIPLGVYFYYVLIEAWCLGYAFKYIGGGIGVAGRRGDRGAGAQRVRAVLRGFTGSVADGAAFSFAQGWNSTLLVPFLLTVAVNICCVYRGLSRGIETFCKWAMPAMACDRADRARPRADARHARPGQARAERDQRPRRTCGTRDFDKLWDAQTWLAAAGQIFFSLSVGFGVIINYASYMRKKDDVVLSGLTASATNEFFEVGLRRPDHADRRVRVPRACGTRGAARAARSASASTRCRWCSRTCRSATSSARCGSSCCSWPRSPARSRCSSRPWRSSRRRSASRARPP